MSLRRSLVATALTVPVAFCALSPTSASAATHRAASVSRNNLHTTPSRPNASATYSNWAGYQMRAANPTGAHATWNVPAVTWQGRDGYSNQWVGIGGGNGAQGQLIQAGTESDDVCVSAKHGRCTASRATYYLWLETYPQRSQERVTNLPVTPGDAVDVQVSYQASSSTATFKLCNLTRHSCVTASRSTSPPRGVAEFIVERPSDASGRQLALANYRSSAFSNMQITDSSRTLKAGALPTTHITMSTAHVLATANGLRAGGDSFTTTFQRPA